MVIGPATRLARLATDWDKSYDGVVAFGRRTSTDDVQGETMATGDEWRAFTKPGLRAAMARLVGRIDQHPPAYSAKKVAGRRAYARARDGEVVALDAVSVVIHTFTLEAWTPPRLDFTCRVSSGAYVRSLARDLGEALGCPAHLEALRRTAAGPFRVTEAVALDAVTPAAVFPPARMAVGLPRCRIDRQEWEAFAAGRQIPADAEDGPLVAVFHGEDLVGLAEPRAGRLQPRVVLGGPAC